MDQYHYSSFPPPPSNPPYSLWLALTAVVVFLASAVAIFLWVGRRRFYRTNSAGVEEFKNYSSAVLTMLVEKVALVVAMACLLAGVFSRRYRPPRSVYPRHNRQCFQPADS